MKLKRFFEYNESTKYDILEDIELIFADVSDKFSIVDNVYQYYKDNTINIRINDKSINPYADDNYFIDIILDEKSSKVATNNIDDMKENIPYLKSAIEKLESIP